MKVYFRKLSENEILDYVGTGEPMDRAGAYAFQHLGFNLTAKMEGNFSTAIGLPMPALYNGLKKFGVRF